MDGELVLMEDEIIEEEIKPKGEPPKFRGDGIAVWVNKTDEGEQYLSVKLFGKYGITINCFKYKPK